MNIIEIDMIIICEDTGEFCDNYRAYQKTKHWKELKRVLSETYVKQGLSVDGLVMHHLNYNHLGCEKVGRDVVLVTKEQHMFIHKHNIEFVKNGKEITTL